MPISLSDLIGTTKALYLMMSLKAAVMLESLKHPEEVHPLGKPVVLGIGDFANQLTTLKATKPPHN